MSTTVTYKGSTLTTVNNQTRTLKTAGKYMEGDVVLTDVSSSGGYVTQDQDGFIILPPDGGSPSVGGLEYEMGTWSPSEDVVQPTISFTDTHTTRPCLILMSDVSDTSISTQYSCASFMYTNTYDAFNHAIATSVYLGRCNNVRYSTSYSAGGYWLQSNGSGSSSVPFFVSETAFYPYIGDSYYWRTGRTYKWIAVWAPTT